MQFRKRAAISMVAATTAVAVAVTGVGAMSGVADQPTTATTITGQGATFPNPIYQEWISQYGNDFPGGTVTVSYTGTGSGAGIKSMQGATPTGDFAGTDAAMTDAELAAASANGGVQHIPTVVGPIVLGYNLPGLKTYAGKPGTLRLSAGNIAGIYTGRIKYWDDLLLKKTNPTLRLPHLVITPVRRADASGTTFGFSSFLYSTSTTWKRLWGAGPSKSWPAAGVAGIATPRNSGVANKVFKTRGAIGYMELSYAVSSGLPMARVQNLKGNFVAPSASSAALAASTASFGSDLRGPAIINAPGYGAYPIVSSTYVLVFKNYSDANKAKAVVSFLSWGLTEGQGYARLFGYAPLPTTLRNRALAALHTIRANGSIVWP